MKTHYKLALAVLAGVSSGVAAAQAIHAQQVKGPPAYVIAEVEKDPTKLQDRAAARKYAEEAPKSLLPFNGQYVVRGGKIQTVEGEASTGYIVVIAFDSLCQWTPANFADGETHVSDCLERLWQTVRNVKMEHAVAGITIERRSPLLTFDFSGNC
jgi:uncharacterized protein (DUF1330 family)